jgi:hypothetical protein
MTPKRTNTRAPKDRKRHEGTEGAHAREAGGIRDVQMQNVELPERECCENNNDDFPLANHVCML